jgi:flagella basal body P-ring formation protein FlgA
MTRLLIFSALFSAAAPGGCLPVAGDRILGLDLAFAIPSLPAAITVGFAPAPGMRRVFSSVELARIARANHVTLTASPSDVCFEIPLHALTEEETRDAMRLVLPAGTELTIVDLPKIGVPAGRLEFPLTSLEPAARGARVWRGFVHYGETLRMPVQARVTVQRKLVAVVASKDLPSNTRLDAASVRLESVSVPLDAEHLASGADAVLGRVTKKPIHAGEPIPLALLSTPPVIRRGDAIKVEVRSGGARLVFDAVAQTDAGDGEIVELRNPESGKTFRARAAESGRAVIVVPSRQTL